jgi:hypothetical protein
MAIAWGIPVKHVLRSGFQQIEILKWYEDIETREAEAEPLESQTEYVLEFSDAFSAETYLRRFMHDPMSMAVLREVASELTYADVSRMDDQEAIRLLAWRMARGAIKLASRAEARQSVAFPIATAEDEQAQMEALVEETPPAEETSLDWVEFRFVDAETGEPLTGVSLKLKLPDGQTKELKTNASGVIRLTNLVPGTVDIEEVISNDALEIVQFE